MLYDVVMPQLGLTMTEGSVTTWLKKPGDPVQKGEMLFTVETDKVEMEVEATRSGYLHSIFVEPGKVVPVGTVIASLSDSASEDAADSRGAAAGPALPAVDERVLRAAQAPVCAATGPGGPQQDAPGQARVLASPRARSLAARLGVSLSDVAPAGQGRISEADVRRHYESFRAACGPQQPRPGSVGPSGARAAVASRMTMSFQSAPHFYLGADIDATELVRCRAALIAPLQASAGVRLTYTDLFLKALALALSERPDVNSCWREGRVTANPAVEVGFAVQTPQALLVPVIRRADELTLAQIATARCALTEKARSGKLVPDDLDGGSATLSNLGPFGVDWFQAILNPPQSIILAAGRIASKPRVAGGRIEARESLTLTVSVDHRVMDGAGAASFLARIQQFLENPCTLLL
jgi:pyruvate dehydrogenase E2 component (dihydrolipoamide acetyltransferase)